MTIPLGPLGFLMVAVFMVLVIRKWVGATPALILVPVAFSLLGGFGIKTFGFMLTGLSDVAPTAVMLIFALLYFSLMIDAGLFQPLVRLILRWAGNDPAKATVGHAALVSSVGLDGSGATTFLLCASSIRPVYRRLGINPLIYATISVLAYLVVHLTPWGGPAARVAAALHVSPAALCLPLLPVAASGALVVYIAAWFVGRRERTRIAGTASPDLQNQICEEDVRPDSAALSVHDETALRPHLAWLNLLMTVILMVCVVGNLAPLPVLFMIATAAALLVNYPDHAEQRARLKAHGSNALDIGLMVLAAGAFTGVMKQTGMTEGMAHALLSIFPPSFGPHLGLITALISIPANVFLSPDAFYFGVVPVLERSAATYGIAPEVIGRASLLGVPMCGLCPLIPAVYLNCSLAGVELGELQRFAWKAALSFTMILILLALLFRAI